MLKQFFDCGIQGVCHSHSAQVVRVRGVCHTAIPLTFPQKCFCGHESHSAVSLSFCSFVGRAYDVLPLGKALVITTRLIIQKYSRVGMLFSYSFINRIMRRKNSLGARSVQIIIKSIDRRVNRGDLVYNCVLGISVARKSKIDIIGIKPSRKNSDIVISRA